MPNKKKVDYRKLYHRALKLIEKQSGTFIPKYFETKDGVRLQLSFTELDDNFNVIPYYRPVNKN